MMQAEDLAVDALARRCAEETDRFHSRASTDPAYCFELFRRALADGSLEALVHIYQGYEPQVCAWAYRHRGFAQARESADFFAHAALSAFYFALRGPKFRQFSTLPQVLSYLKLCVHTAIVQHLRDYIDAATIPLQSASDVVDLPHLDAGVEAAELWTYICHLLPDERDRLLARCAFVQDFKPRQIVQAYPSYWTHEREVSVALYRIRRLLRNDPELQRLSGHPRTGGSGHM